MPPGIDYRNWRPDFKVQLAINKIKSDFDDNVKVTGSLLKFGENTDLGTTEQTVWLRGGIETLPTNNPIDTVSSSDAGDTQDIIVQGYTINGATISFSSQDTALNGQNKVVLSTPLYRSTRMFNNDSSDFSGTVYVYEDGTITGGVPDDSALIHLQTDGTNNQSLKAATVLGSNEYWILNQATFGVNRSQSRVVDFKIQVREFGKVFRTTFPFTASTESGTKQVDFDPCVIIRKSSDVRVQATSSGVSTVVDATLNGYIAEVQ